jgi:hypothetical protein
MVISEFFDDSIAKNQSAFSVHLRAPDQSGPDHLAVTMPRPARQVIEAE